MNRAPDEPADQVDEADSELVIPEPTILPGTTLEFSEGSNGDELRADNSDS